MSHKVSIAVLTLLLSGLQPALAQTTPQPDPLRDALTPPDVALKHAQALGLSDGQMRTIQTDAVDAQSKFVRVQWQLKEASDKLLSLLKESRIDQSRALAQLDNVLHLEREVKRIQLGLMIAVKNTLTAQQQAAARQFASTDEK